MATVPVSERAGTSEVARHIARVAARLFATRGFDATSVREIVEEAGVTKPTLYYHFGSKEGLAQALLTVPMTRTVEAMRGLIAAAGDPVEALVGLVDTHLSFCREDPDRGRFFFALFFGPRDSGSHLAAGLCRFGEGFDAMLAQVVDRLAAAGAVDPGRVGAFVVALRGLIIVHVLDHLYRGAELGPGLACRLVGDLLEGFGAAGPGRGSK